MKNISSLICHLFSHYLEAPNEKMGFATVASSDKFPDELKNAELLLLVVRQTSERTVHQIVGFSNTREFASTSYVLESAERLPDALEASALMNPWKVPDDIVLLPRENSKTFFFRNTCLWSQHTLLEKCMSYVIQEVPGNSKELLFHSIHGGIRRQATYQKKQYCPSVKKWIREQKSPK